MNVVLVSHCNFLGQSAYHVYSVAKKLTARGCACIICVPDDQGRDDQYIHPDIPVMDYEGALRQGLLFSDGNPPALIHCWTPREHVRRFVETMVDMYRCPYVVHFEDNELEILKRYLKSLGYEEFDPMLLDEINGPVSTMVHPQRYLPFVQKAAGVTVLIDRLLEHVPPGIPGLVFWPGYEEIFSFVTAADRQALRKQCGISPKAFVIYYCGNFHAINQDEIGQLLRSLEFLKKKRIPFHFIKTGINDLPDIMRKAQQNIPMTDFGFVPRKQLPELFAMTDIIVQPGVSDAFNDYRFPSKLPEALIAGKPVILPRSNLGHFLIHGFNALITDTGTDEELAEKILTLYHDRKLRRIIGVNGRNFALIHLQWEDAVEKIWTFYKEIYLCRAVSSDLKPDLAVASALLDQMSGDDRLRHQPDLKESLNRIQNHVGHVFAAADRIEQNLNSSQRVADIRIETQRSRDDMLTFYGQDSGRNFARRLLLECGEALRATWERCGSLVRLSILPMQYMFSKIKNTVNVLKLMPSIFRLGGGLAGTMAKTWRVLSAEGLNGMKRRVIFAGGHRGAFLSPMVKTGLFSQAVNRNNYGEWIHRYDKPTVATQKKINSEISAMPVNPLISVLLPVYNPEPRWLIETIESVRKQLYRHWELCVADDASTKDGIHDILERYAKEDARIKVILREKNGHISAASNTALEQAAGEWIALLDHDDVLAEDALFWVAHAVNNHPEARVIYSDEDKIDGSGARFDPYFKCDWNKDLFYSHNMISHLGIYRADLLRAVGGFREGLEGSQDYDLALRCIEHIEARQIIHIPRVLYHWRAHDSSTAKSMETKPYAAIAGEMALNEHFQRQGVLATAEHIGHGYRVRYALPDPVSPVSLIIPTKNKLSLLKKCVDSILEKTTYPDYEILIVDNASDDPATLQYLNQLTLNPKIRLMRHNGPFNYSAVNNEAVKEARGEIVGLLNNDLEVISAEWLTEMVSFAMLPGVGAVGARLWYPDNTLQHGGVILGLGGVAGHSHPFMPRHHNGYFGRASLISSFSAVSAACLVIRKCLYVDAGGMNEKDLPVAFNDVDLCLRLGRAGYRNVWTPYAELYHLESASRGHENTPERQKRFAGEAAFMKKRWGHVLLSDPAYSPNLTLHHGDFSLAWPPRNREF